jgi:hypothetical protein
MAAIYHFHNQMYDTLKTRPAHDCKLGAGERMVGIGNRDFGG